jgi:DNA polymerase-1
LQRERACSTKRVDYASPAVPRVLLLDTNSLFIRAFFALPPMTTLAGQPTSALYGLCVLLLKLLREERPHGLSFARDTPGPTFRHVNYAEYKGHRQALSSNLREQFPLLDRLLHALDVPVFAAPGFEADDILARLAIEIAATGQAVRIVTGDRDLLQIVRPHVDVLFVGRRGQQPVVYDEAAVQARFHLRPDQLPSLIALVGDPADNLPKVAGIGQRTAERLIGRFGDARGLLDRVSEIESASVRGALEAAAEQVLRTETLARLRVDVPLPDAARFGVPSLAALQSVRALFVEWEFASLIARLDKLEIALTQMF